MTSDRDLIEQGLRKFEQDIHRDGWDQPPLLTTMGLTATRFVMVKSPPFGGNVAEFLTDLADELDRDVQPIALAFIAEAAASAGFVGFALCVENWMNDQMTPQQWRDKKKSLADIVGSKEARTVAAIDIDGNVYGILRPRGEKPIIDPQVVITGPEIRALHRITLAVASFMPGRDLTGLRALHIPTADEAYARYVAQRRGGQR